MYSVVNKSSISTFGGFLVGLAAFRLDLDEGQVSEDVGEYGTRSEVDSGLLDERFLPVLFFECALAGDTDLECSDVAQADDFPISQRVGDHVFECHKHGEHITLVYGTCLLDAFGHFAEADVAVGLHMGIKLRVGFKVARIDARGYGIGYVSCHSLVGFQGLCFVILHHRVARSIAEFKILSFMSAIRMVNL